MICFPNCKINLGLFITHRRADGYHDLETVFLPVAKAILPNARQTQGTEIATVLNDALEVVPAHSTPKMHLSGRAVSGNAEDNLVWKAYKMLQSDFGDSIPALDIFLHKAIPMGAGLGGGSADGAFMLILLNEYCQLGLSALELGAYALRLGSDCPFFIYNSPQFATGRGEIMQAIDVDLTGYEIRIICPEIHVSTRDAFALIQPRPAPFDLRNIGKIPVSDWKNVVSNDFEGPVFNKHPELKKIKERFYEEGAVYASMTGTGAAVYGIFSRA